MPRIVGCLTALPAETAVLDAELVAGDGGFWTIPRAIAEEHVAIAAFDLLHLDGAELRPEPLISRKAKLAELVRRAAVPCLLLVDHFDDGTELLRAAELHGLEGIVSKRRNAPYRSGRRPEWVKTKTAAWREANRERWREFAR
jgi:bifunctional non-homologous end joining protein LigD